MCELLEAAEEDLHGNLYRLWNRLSSGSYFPPPVRAVEIPKRDGSSRTLGVPTVADRIAQTVVRSYLEPDVEPVFHGDFYNARVEQINTQIRLIIRRGFGYQSPDAVIALAMLSLGGLCPPLPER